MPQRLELLGQSVFLPFLSLESTTSAKPLGEPLLAQPVLLG